MSYYKEWIASVLVEDQSLLTRPTLISLYLSDLTDCCSGGMAE